MPQTYESKIYSLPTSDQVSQAANHFLELKSKEAIAKHGRFTVAFSGGSLPTLVTKYAAHNPNIDFSKWFIFFADERCVAHSSPDSNYKLVVDEFIQKVNANGKTIIPEQNIFAINQSLVHNSEEAAEDYEHQLTSVFVSKDSVRYPIFDLILLGMGPDGHTCSLFPGYPQVQETGRWITHIDNSPKPPSSRITLTLPVINDAHNVAFFSTGAGKAAILKEILDERSEKYPSAKVIPHRGNLYWFLDSPASSQLQESSISPFGL
ncbi:hypothetical protein BB561_006637 [Smittium simulii]|uniref:6-phosphogluconolactonase n=1 Tax=Smittium simulii TaxID=133385 RepID=A0A2T9Y2T5_9FUNG|nr:hypothetical protein BB561_006637 [Smittium simulii]